MVPNFPQVVSMQPSCMLPDLPTGALTTVHTFCVPQPPSAGFELHHKYWAPFNPPRAWSTDCGCEGKQMLRCTCAAHCTVICVITGPIPRTPLPHNKPVHWTRNEAPMHTQNWAVLSPTPQGTEPSWTLPLGMKGNQELSPGKGQWRASTWLYGMEGAGSCCCLSHHDQSNGRVTWDWVMFSAERGGADLALLHSQNTAGGNSPSVSHFHHGLLQLTLPRIYL